MHGLNRPLVRPPVAERRPAFSVHHGVELVDEYAWLRAGNWQEVMRDPGALDPGIRTYLEAENAFADAAMADTRLLQEELFAEMKGRIKEDDASVPTPDGGFEYFTSYVTGGQYVRVCRRPRGGGPEEILLDGNKEAEG
ncbi:MAG TPA: S9 family peptidase, partial [Hyphomicrobiaceae bacterium]|nr:S9 family peptidase [Hyphomicrobiaceae bacterium]